MLLASHARDDFVLCRKYPCIHWSIKGVPSSTSTARFSTLANQTRAYRSPMWKNSRTMPSMLTTSQFAVSSCSYLIDMMDYVLACGTKSLFIELVRRPYQVDSPLPVRLSTISLQTFGQDMSLWQRSMQRRQPIIKLYVKHALFSWWWI